MSGITQIKTKISFSSPEESYEVQRIIQLTGLTFDAFAYIAVKTEAARVYAQAVALAEQEEKAKKNLTTTSNSSTIDSPVTNVADDLGGATDAK